MPIRNFINADTVDGFHASKIPTSNTIPVAGDNGKINIGWLNASQTPAPNTIPVAGDNGKISIDWIPQGVGSNLNADTVDGFHASTTPAPNVIVPLNANGILDLSATYVKSNVYTFRRVDLTNSTSDYMLQVGEEAYISFSGANATTAPLRIATQSGTYYEVHLVCSNPGGTSGAAEAAILLLPNNTTYSNAFVYADTYRTSGTASSSYTTLSAFRCGYAFTSSVFYITNFTQYKNVKGFHDTYGISLTYPAVVIFSTDWRDTTTPWVSLGTIVFPQTTSGYILVRRLV